MDIRLAFNPTRQEFGGIDLLLEGSDLASGHELESAVIMSLFTNRRAEADDVLPSAFADRQGFWGDQFPTREGDKMGSRLWLLSAEKQTNETRLRALEYAAEALQWLIDDRVASEVRIQAEYVRQHFLGLRVEILHGNGVSTSYEYLWDQLKNQLSEDQEFTIGGSQTYLMTENGNRLLTESGQTLVT